MDRRCFLEVCGITWSRQPVEDRPFLSSSENWGREMWPKKRGEKGRVRTKAHGKNLEEVPQKCAAGEADCLRRQMRGGLAGV